MFYRLAISSYKYFDTDLKRKYRKNVTLAIFLSIFSSGLTHFGLSSAPIFYSNSYLKVKTWWYSGFIISIMYIIIWITIGSIWWKIIGLW